jgi:large subunit ribosomal protein L19
MNKSIKIINEILLKYVKNFNIINLNKKLNVGNLISLKYLTFKNKKEYIQKINGLIILKKNNLINTNITIRRFINNTLIEQTFFLNNSNILNIDIISKYKIRKSKLYYLRNLKNKYKKLKIIK